MEQIIMSQHEDYPLKANQAEKVRGLRRLSYQISNIVSEMAVALARACEHDDIQKGCPVCRLYFVTTTIQDKCTQLFQRMDSYLERGPNPSD